MANETPKTETASRKQTILAAVAILLIGSAIAYGLWAFRSDDAESPLLAYYSIDDGKTYFADDAIKTVPFDKDGKEAVKAYVFECADGKTRFVSHLERMSPQAKAEIDGYVAKGTAPDASVAMRLSDTGVQLKRPGEPKWQTREDFNKANPEVKCPTGDKQPPMLLLP